MHPGSSDLEATVTLGEVSARRTLLVRAFAIIFMSIYICIYVLFYDLDLPGGSFMYVG